MNQKNDKTMKIFKRAAHFSALLPLLVLCLLASCQGEQFHVTGTIGGAKDSTLYFEHNTLDGFTVVDSVALDDKGAFSFSGDKAENPEFYRLRIAGQIINIGIDSTETVTVQATYPMMATNYKVQGSYENEKIRELALKQIALQNQCNQVVADPATPDVNAAIDQLLRRYKDDVMRNYIFKEPMRGYAYFALFQYVVINGQPIMVFNPRQDATDNKVFGAVATSWDTFYPNTDRTLNLHNITLKGMKDERIAENNQRTMQMEQSKVRSLGIIPITLTDNHGQQRALTSLRGKVVLLDFHVFGTQESAKRIMNLRALYDKYHAQGFEIYQVSLDDNEHFFKTQTASLPWICVWDPDGLNSQTLVNYNIQSLPTYFIIDRNNQLQKRDVQIQNLDAEIQHWLGQAAE